GHGVRGGPREASVGAQGEQALHGEGAAPFGVGRGGPGADERPAAVGVLGGVQCVEVGLDLGVGEEAAGQVAGVAGQVQGGVDPAQGRGVEFHDGADHGDEAGEFGAGASPVGCVLEEDADRVGVCGVGRVEGGDAAAGEGGGAVPPGAGDAVLVEQARDGGGGVEGAGEVAVLPPPGGGLGVADAGEDGRD